MPSIRNGKNLKKEFKLLTLLKLHEFDQTGCSEASGGAETSNETSLNSMPFL
jgi:hypothetical protein